MTLRVSGKSISVGDALRGRVSERTDEVLRKYFDGNYSGHITFSKDGSGFRTDCALHLDSGITLEADSNALDAYASADQALLMIEKRLRRYKSRLKDRSGLSGVPARLKRPGKHHLSPSGRQCRLDRPSGRQRRELKAAPFSETSCPNNKLKRSGDLVQTMVF